MKERRTFMGALALALLAITVITGLTYAQGPDPQRGASVQASPVGTAFTYQGYLEDASGPLDSTCDFQFSLWDAAGSGSSPTGGTQIGTT